MSALRLLVRPTLFTAGVCGTCFCGSAIIKYENRRKDAITVVVEWVQGRQVLNPRPHRTPRATGSKFLEFRQRVNARVNQLSAGQKIACSAIFVNSIVLVCWKLRGLRPIMRRFFMCHPPPPLSAAPQKIPLSPMILSCFSHSTVLHFACNMYALYSVTTFATAMLGPEQLIGLFISAGAVSSLTSLAYKLITKSHMPSLGASGALLGMFGYACTKRPEVDMFILFIPMVAGTAIKGIMALDTIGMIARWRYLDHAAHLGGSLFGVWYATTGERLYYQNRSVVIDNWLKLMGRIE